MPAHYFQRFMDIIEKLRSPTGCPWDNEQTPESLRSSLLEEAHECIDAINSGDDNHINEELGDLFLLAGMISYIKEQQGAFTVESVLENVTAKLVRRHPHVFAESTADTPEAVIEQWDAIKRDVEGRTDEVSILNTVPKSLPPLERAYRFQKKAAKVGFDWKDPRLVYDKVDEEIEELKALGSSAPRAEVEGELGDLLFAVINLSRHFGVDPAIALHSTNLKFARRFNHIERSMALENRQLDAAEFERMDELWDEAKSVEK